MKGFVATVLCFVLGMVSWSQCKPYGGGGDVGGGDYPSFGQESYGGGGYQHVQEPAAEQYHQGAGGEHDDSQHHEPVHYSFHYDVHDPHTGDVKSQHETRTGDVVTGFYTLVEPDGTIRTVKYKADKHSGFNAVVDRKKPDFGVGLHGQHY